MGLIAGKSSAGKTWPAIMVGLFVAFGGILYGYDTGTISGILGMEYWIKQFARDRMPDGTPYVGSTDKSLIVSILSVGTFIGALMAAPLADFLGRRIGLMVSCGVFSVGVALQTAASAVPMFVAGRFIAGWGVGMLSAQVPLYQSETAPKWIRGTIVGSYQLAITIGLLLAASANKATSHLNNPGSYRIPIGIQFAWAFILVVGMIFLPETPRFRIRQGRFEDAQKALSTLRRLPRDHPEVIAELQEIQANHEYEMSIGKASYIELLKSGNNRLRTRLLTGMALQALQQLTGVNFIFYYGTVFFQSAGFKDAFLIILITNLVNVISTLPGLYLVEKWGRRQLLLFGAAGMAICQLLVATVGTLSHTQTSSNVLIAFVCIYIFFFACSWGPIAWVVTGELFPLKARAKALSITTATNWLLNWAIGFSTPFMVDAGPGNANMGAKVFFVWGGFCVVCFAFVYTYIYETKGMSLEDVDDMYANVKSARKSNGYVPKTRNEERKMEELQEIDVNEERGTS